jgi:hypothetical protein
MGDNFDHWLEDELGRRLGDIDPGYVAPRYLATAAPRRGRVLRFVAGLPLPALLTTKVAAASMVVLAATGTGVVVKTATTGTPNPLVWGQQVKDQVQTCKDKLAAGQHGIGECVSNFASHKPTATPSSGTGSADGTANPTDGADSGNGNNGVGTGSKPQPTPQGKSDGHPTPQGKSDTHPTPQPHPTAGVGNGSGTSNGGGKP